jgi:TPR repeat protein
VELRSNDMELQQLLQ